MSTTVDQRVVEMRFDNKQFESGVATTMSTLDKFKQKLNLKGASDGLKNIGAEAKKVDMSGLSNGIETVHAKFSALQVIGTTALVNITNSALNAGKKIASALTIDPIKTGFQEYETQINAVQTILANTQKEGATIKDVNGALDELNTYADKTIYNFTEMTRNIGTFTAAGIKLDTSVNAIQGIANLAAVSGSTSQQASTAMYQLSQALASGTVKLMDWNSVVNAGMGGQVFQDALKETSKELGTGAEAAIKANGSFRESLQTGWLTSEVLTETLKKFTSSGANEYVAKYTGLSEKAVESALKEAEARYGEADAIDKASEALAKKSGKNKKEIKEALQFAKTAEDAATKVKTFTQLWDTLKEAAQSGWSQSWRIIVGDFEEAKELFTEISDTLGAMIGKSADARNKVLQGWKDMGGRKAIVDALKNTFEGILSIIKPIKEAFREIFPPTTAKQLVDFSKALRDLTAKIKISDNTAEKLKKTFKGIFSVFSIGIEIIKAVVKGVIDLVKNFSGIEGGILSATASIGDWITNIRNSIKETEIFGSIVGKVTGFITNIINKIKEFGRALKDSINFDGFNGFLGFFKGILDLITKISSGIISAFSSVGSNISDGFGDNGFFELLNGGLFAGILIGINKFVKGLSDPFESAGGILENVKGILDDVRGCFKAYQEQLKAGALLKIASAIAILSAAIFVISTIDGDSLLKSLGAITVLFGELLGALSIFSKITTKMSGVTKSISMMIGISIAIVILSSALKKISSIDASGIIKGLIAIGALMGELLLFLKNAKFDGKIARASIGIVILSSAMLILAKAVKNFGGMSWSDIGKGLVSIGGLLTELAIFSRITGNAKHVISTGIAMILLASSMKIFSSVIKDFGKMSLESIGKGLLAMAGALAEITIAMRLMPKNTILIGTGLLIVASAMKVLYSALSDLGSMNWSSIAKSLTIMGGALLELTIALNLMKGTVSGSLALIIAAGALAIIAPVMKTLGSMSWESIAKGLIALAGAFTVVGVAGAVLGSMIPAILGLAASFALFGVAMLGIGAGIALIGIGLTTIAAGITALAASVSAGATAIVAGITVIITGLLDLIPTIAEKLGEGLIEFSKVIGECAPTLADSILKLLSSLMDSLANYVPKIVDSLMILLIGIINGLADHMPTLIQAVVNLIGSILNGVIEALNGVDTSSILKGVIAVGLMTALMYALSGIVGLIPSAMLGLVGVGAVIAELALILAAIGKLSEIPGLQMLIGKGGDLLQSIGTAIGKFVGGIAGGLAEGMTSSLPNIATNLSNFMKNLQPFIDGVKNLDSSMLGGVTSLVGVILSITAADVINSITSFITGGNSISNFAAQLVPFGKGLSAYSNEISNVNSEAVANSAKAVKALANMASEIPNTGGLVSCITGDNSLADFGKELVSFGPSLLAYSVSVSGVNSESIINSSKAVKALANMASEIPNTGGLVSCITGDNSLSAFGSELASFGPSLLLYSVSISGINTESIINSAKAVKALANMAAEIPNTGGLVSCITGDNSLSTFGSELASFGPSLLAYSMSISGVNSEAVTASAKAVKELAKMASEIPNTGGLVAAVTGDNSLSTFGSELALFGPSLLLYSVSVSGINSEAVTASAKAVKELANMAAEIPNTGGLVSCITGDNSLSTFGSELSLFGPSLLAYSISVSGVNAEAVSNSAKAVKALAKMASEIPSTGGLVAAVTGDNSLSTFGSELALFGPSLLLYSVSVAGINSESIINSAKAVKALAKMAAEIPNTGGLVAAVTGDNSLSTFGSELALFGPSLLLYSMSISGVNSEAVTASAKAVKELAKMAAEIPNAGGLVAAVTGDNSLSTFGSELASFGPSLSKYSESISGINTGVIIESVSAVKSLAKMAEALDDMDYDSIEALPKDDLVSIGKALTAFSNSLEGINTLLISKSINAAKGTANMIKTLNGISYSTLKSFPKESLKSTGKSLTAFSNSLKGINTPLIQKSINAAKSISSFIKNLKGVNSSAVSSFNKALNSISKKSVDNFVNAFKGASSKSLAAGAKMVSNLAKGIKSNSTAPSKAFLLIINNLVKTIKSKTSTFSNIGKDIDNSMAKAITKYKTSVSSAAKTVVSGAAKGAKEKYSSFYSTGESLGKGLVKGINAKKTEAYNAGYALGKKSAKGVKDGAKVNSPSKLTIPTGEGLGEGLILGISRVSKSVYKSGNKLGKSAASSISKAISRASEIIDGGINTQPTIRPVIDLSDVESGAGAISKIFGNGQSIQLSSNIKSINSMMNKRNQNGNSELLSAIQGLRSDYSSQDRAVHLTVNMDYNAGSDANEIANDIANSLRRAVRRGV